MHKISLKDWVIMLTIIPTTLISLAIAGYFSYSRHIELDDYLTNRAKSIIEPLAIISAEPLLNKERDKLRHLIGFAHRSQSEVVKSITIFTQDNQIFVSSAYHSDTNLMRLGVGESIPTNALLFESDEHLIFRAPIISEISTKSLDNNKLAQIDLTPHQNTVGYIAMLIDKDSIKFSQQSQLLVAFTIALIGVLISAIFALRLIKNVTRPVTSMVQAVDRIREGKLESRISGQLIGELNFLKNGVNAMAQSLGDYNDEMQRSIDQATIDLRESLEQFEIQNVELDLAKRKAQDANKVKSEFLANMSHELRTPLNGVIGFTRQVLKTPLSHIQRDYLQTIERSAANLLSIINDILDFSKLDAGKMEIESIPFSLHEVCEEALTLLAPSAHQKNIELSVHIEHALPDSLIGDAMRIKQVIINLASNAIKFTEEGSVNINISCEKNSNQKAMLKVQLRDTGVGMSKAQQSTIFEAFGQADKSVTRLYGGTGLGLVISQRLATEMNGNIGFESNEGKGSIFWFTFECEINPIPLLSMLNTHELAEKRVLYFEPHTHSRTATAEIMTGWKMNVALAHNLEQMKEILSKQSNFDFILIGHDIHPMAISELKQLLKAIEFYGISTHIALNSNSPSIQESIIASGAASCLSKPIMPNRLFRAFAQQNVNIQPSQEEERKSIPIKVLAVDDNDANLRLIKALLLEQVAEVITATNGQEALTLCQNEKFAMIFMDIQMPVMDGVTALNAIKAKTFNDNTPIIAVTAHALSSEKDKLLQQGFDFYMTKPIDENMLKHTIYEYCDLAQTNDSITADSTSTITTLPFSPVVQKNKITNSIIDWQMALERAANNESLAQDMLKGLIDSLAETKQLFSEALTIEDLEQLKTIIHKLNGTCCYTGAPNLANIGLAIESALKKGESIDDLQPEFLELFEHIDNVLAQGPKVLAQLNSSHLTNEEEKET